MFEMRKYILCIIFFLSGFHLKAEISIKFHGAQHEIISETPDKSTGLNTLYIIRNINDIMDLTITGINITDCKLFIYSNLGGAFAKEIDVKKQNDEIILQNPTGNCGYILENGSERYYFWIVDYSVYNLSLKGIKLAESQICGETIFNIDGTGLPVVYYSINGRPIILDREIEIKYDICVWDKDNMNFNLVQEKKYISSFDKEIRFSPALNASTEIIISGDRFLKKWGEEQLLKTYVNEPNGLTVETVATLLNKNENSDRQPDSAPLEYRFSAYVTEAVIHNEWQIARDPDFSDIEYSFIEKEFEFTFTEEGERYVRFTGSNSDGSCVEYGSVYEIKIGASELKIPNSFSPNGDGINDIWKISGKSLLSFKCWIFDRYGKEIFFFDDPSVGWDGTYKGKPVVTGVYYYVIEAIGSDNKKYKKGGDINLIKLKKHGFSTVE